jgi:hypothetical protein
MFTALQGMKPGRAHVGAPPWHAVPGVEWLNRRNSVILPDD